MTMTSLSKDVIDLLNSKLAIVAALAISVAFTMYYVSVFAPYAQDRNALESTLKKLTDVSVELTLITNRLAISDARQSVLLEEISRRQDQQDRIIRDQSQ